MLLEVAANVRNMSSGFLSNILLVVEDTQAIEIGRHKFLRATLQRLNIVSG